MDIGNIQIYVRSKFCKGTLTVGLFLTIISGFHLTRPIAWPVVKYCDVKLETASKLLYNHNRVSKEIRFCIHMDDLSSKAEPAQMQSATTANRVTSRGKQRSKVACRHCRRRKVRCDVYPRGSPCTNCRLDELECVLCDNKRQVY